MEYPPSRSVDRADLPGGSGITGGMHLAGIVVQVDHHGVADRPGDRFHQRASLPEVGGGSPADSFLLTEFARLSAVGRDLQGFFCEAIRPLTVRLRSRLQFGSANVQTLAMGAGPAGGELNTRDPLLFEPCDLPRLEWLDRDSR